MASRMATEISLILGGTAGLGAAVRDELLKENETVAIVGRSASTYNQHAIALPFDFAGEDPSHLVQQLDHLVREGHVISKFFWVTGILTRHPFSKIGFVDMARMIDVNFRNPLPAVQWVYNHQLECGGSFVVVSSTTGISETPSENEAVYAATKASQVSFARALGKNNKNTDLRFTLVCPGGMKTPFWNNNEIDPALYETFLDPAKVAKKICDEVRAQTDLYRELTIPRGSL